MTKKTIYPHQVMCTIRGHEDVLGIAPPKRIDFETLIGEMLNASQGMQAQQICPVCQTPQVVLVRTGGAVIRGSCYIRQHHAEEPLQ